MTFKLVIELDTPNDPVFTPGKIGEHLTRVIGIANTLYHTDFELQGVSIERIDQSTIKPVSEFPVTDLS